jgi:5'-methylthioadenosine phosphorylase
MGGLAVIVGSSALTPDGHDLAGVISGAGAVALQRHGVDDYRPPHLIDHAANMRTLAEAGCDRALAIGSVGSLDAGLATGSFVCPHDFIALHLGVTTFDDARGHTLPGFDPEWRRELIAAWGVSGAAALRDGGVYWQTKGPRFETPAEIALIAPHADVVGMTLAAECIVAREIGLSYAAVCVVDNLANGVAARQLSTAALEAEREANARALRTSLEAVMPGLVA